MKKYFISIFFIFLTISLFSNDSRKSLSKSDSELLQKIYVFEENENCNKEEKKGVFFSNEVPKKNLLKKNLVKFLNKQVNYDLLNDIVQAVNLHYTKSGYALNFAKVEDQNKNEVKIKVLLAKLGKINAKGAKYFKNVKIKNNIAAIPGEIINTNDVRTSLNILNENNFRNCSLYYEKGENFGETNIIVETEDRFPVRVYGGYDFTGYTIAGQSRYIVGTNIGTFYLFDHELSYQYMFYPSAYRWGGHSGSYKIPLIKGYQFLAFGYYIKTRPKSITFGETNGYSWMLSGKILKSIDFRNYQSEVFLSYEYKRTNNFFDYLTNSSITNFVDISQVVLSYSGSLTDSLGKTAFGINGYISPGNMTRYNTKKKFQSMRPGAKPSYVYVIGRFDRITKLYKDINWVLDLRCQFSSTKLLPSEEFSLGGANSVRGYDENTLIGDMGFLIKNEIRTPNFKFLNFHTLLFLAFIDYGKLYEKDQNITKSAKELCSTGVGLRYFVKDNFTARFDYGFQIKNVKTKNGNSSRAHVGVNLSY